MPTLLLDVDHVILDWLQGFAGWMEDRGTPAQASPDDEADYTGLSTMYPGLGVEAVRALVVQFNRSPAFERIPSVPGALKGLSAIRAAHPSLPIACVTAAGAGPETEAMRRRTLARIGLHEVVVVPLWSPKSEAYRTFPPGSVVVDDMPHHLEEAVAAGHRPVLFAAPSNRACTAFPRAEGWPDLQRIVKNLLAA